MDGRVAWLLSIALLAAACQTGRAAQVEPGQAKGLEDAYWRAGEDRIFPASLSYDNALGSATTINVDGPTSTRGHPFFTALGTNGRACISCHQPSDGMSITPATLRKLWDANAEREPVFSAFDGSNCPNLPQADRASHSLLIEHGLFRIERPWPPRAPDGSAIEPEFELSVISDPTGCNLDREHGVAAGRVSVFRRPRPASNLPYVTATGFSFDPKDGLPLRTDPATGQLISGNVLSDARAGTLEAQAIDALFSHLELPGTIDPSQLAQIIAFERGLFTAQSRHIIAGELSAAGAQGGPQALADFPTGALQSTATPIWSEFFAWRDAKPAADGGGAAELEQRRSIARGAELFSKRTFLIDDSAGVTDMGFGSPVRNGCAFCHNMQHVGLDVAPGQIDLGTTNLPHARLARTGPLRELPLFRLTCREGARPHQHLGRVVETSDPGYALTTGRCIDIGKITAQTMRGLAARPPYFSNGAANTLRELVDFYDERYQIRLSEQEKQDMTRFLEVL
jgi:hypothetical protein